MGWGSNHRDFNELFRAFVDASALDRIREEAGARRANQKRELDWGGRVKTFSLCRHKKTWGHNDHLHTFKPVSVLMRMNSQLQTRSGLYDKSRQITRRMSRRSE
jgi:hypothetical protein